MRTTFKNSTPMQINQRMPTRLVGKILKGGTQYVGSNLIYIICCFVVQGSLYTKKMDQIEKQGKYIFKERKKYISN